MQESKAESQIGAGGRAGAALPQPVLAVQVGLPQPVSAVQVGLPQRVDELVQPDRLVLHEPGQQLVAQLVVEQARPPLAHGRRHGRVRGRGGEPPAHRVGLGQQHEEARAQLVQAVGLARAHPLERLPHPVGGVLARDVDGRLLDQATHVALVGPVQHVEQDVLTPGEAGDRDRHPQGLQRQVPCLPFVINLFSYRTRDRPDPGKQFAKVEEHVAAIRSGLGRKGSRVFVYVERNLGFEAEHHRRALGHLPGVRFYVDQAANRVGVLTTEQVKHGMCQLVVAMLRERRIHVAPKLVSSTESECRIRLREQMEVYGFQFKAPANPFQKERVSLSGKIGGMQDDVCICLQLACYFTQIEEQRAADSFARPE